MKASEPRGTYKFRAKLFRYEGPAAWHFITVPVTHGAAIRALFAKGAQAFGTIRVSVTIGKTEWRTSLFPDTKRKSYLIAVKATVRKAEGLEPDQTVAVTVRVL